MKLRVLEVEIMGLEQFMKYGMRHVEECLRLKKASRTFATDSLETFKKTCTPNRIQILMAISRFKPESIKQLSNLLGREYPHVFNDCKSLLAQGLIELEELDTLRKQLRPKLSFDYDIIRVKAPIEEIYSISERSNKVLLGEVKI